MKHKEEQAEKKKAEEEEEAEAQRIEAAQWRTEAFQNEIKKQLNFSDMRRRHAAFYIKFFEEANTKDYSLIVFVLIIVPSDNSKKLFFRHF